MRRDEAGFTLIELLISAAILGLISIYLTGMLTQQNRAYTVVDQVTETQSNMRAVSALMEREARTTAFMAPEGAAVCGVDYDDAPDVIYVTDADAFLNSSGVKSYNLGAEVLGGFVGTGSGESLQLAQVRVDETPHYDLDADGTADADFKPGAGVIVVDRNNPMRGTACGVIVEDGVDVATRRIEVDFEADGDGLAAVPPNRPEAFLMAVPAHRYMVNDEMQLLRDDLVLADDVEDLQVAYYFDLNDDHDAEIDNADANELRGAAGVNEYESRGVDHSLLREIRLNFVMRSRRPDPTLTGATFQAFENRAAVAGTDGFRRRAQTVSVRPRNLGHRWNVGV